MNKAKILVYDYETGSVDPEFAEPVELAAVVVEPRNLEVVDSFHSFMKPEIWEPPYVTKSTVDFHAKNDGLTPEEILTKWQTYPQQREVWEKFIAFLNKHNERPSKPTQWGAPIPAGQNIRKFDNPITNRLCKKYGNVDKEGKSNIFNKKFDLDLLEVLFLFFENLNELNSFSFDTCREYFWEGDETASIGAHTALVDTRQTAELLIRFMKLCRRTAEKQRFRGALAKNVQEV